MKTAQEEIDEYKMNAPAFNTPSYNTNTGIMNGHRDGMTLRDYFAAKAMQSIVERSYNDISWDHSYEQIAGMAYLQADAMLKEREIIKNK